MKLSDRQVGCVALPHLEVSVLHTGLQLATLFTLLILQAGCFSTHLSSAVMPGVRLTDYNYLYVACHPGDDGRICELIAQEFRRRGLDAVAGPSATVSEDEAVLVAYEDRWTWDITMYLLTLRIDLRDPKTNLLLATGHVYRTSLARKTPEEMVRAVVGAIYEES